MRVRFADFEFDSVSGHLLKGGSRVAMQEKPLHVLSMLLAHAGQLVTREQLFQEIWAGTYVAEDQSLNTAMRKVRLALDDSLDAPKFVETVGSRGYRFIHPVLPAANEGSAPRTLTLAVLPLENLGGEEDEDLIDGIAEAMISRLGCLYPHFTVLALSSVLRYKGRASTVDEMLRELGADYLLSGSIRRSESRVRIATRLIKGDDQTCLWSLNFERDLSDIFAIQNEVAENVARSTARLLTTVRARVPKSAALEIYLRARHFWNKRTAQGVLKSIELFNHALAQDPEYALCYVGLADAYRLLAQNGVLSGLHALPIVKEAALKALTIDNLNAEAHASMAWVKAVYDHDPVAAEVECKTAIELNPNYAFAYTTYSFMLSALNRHRESLESVRRGLQLDPVSLPINVIYAAALHVARQYSAAMEQCLECLELDPEFPMAHAIYGQVLESTGAYAEAEQHFRRNAELAPWDPFAMAHLARISVLQKKPEESRSRLRALLADADHRYVPPYSVAQVYAALQDRDATFHWLNRAADERSSWVLFVNVDPRFDALHSDPRFGALLAKLGLASSEKPLVM